MVNNNTQRTIKYSSEEEAAPGKPAVAEPLIDEKTDSGTSTKFLAKVILYNDDFHSFDEVIEQLIKALNCSTQRAVYLTVKAHSEGKAEVFKGTYARCIKVSSILEEIALRTEIVY